MGEIHNKVTAFKTTVGKEHICGAETVVEEINCFAVDTKL
jgi:hypothetical protein